MIQRASRVFPGVLVSMLLAGPALLLPTPASADPIHKTQAQDHRRVTSSARNSKGTSAKSSLASRRRSGGALASSGHARPHAATTAFVDDTFTYTDGIASSGWRQTGVASWYGGRRWQGHLTSSGARYDEATLTAAHATLPLGSRVRVSLHHSSRSVIVLINDRPGTRSRIIDLSRAAAAELGILDQGVAMVTLSPAS